MLLAKLTRRGGVEVVFSWQTSSMEEFARLALIIERKRQREMKRVRKKNIKFRP